MLQDVISTASQPILDSLSSQNKAFSDQLDKNGYVVLTRSITLSQETKPERWEMYIVEFLVPA